MTDISHRLTRRGALAGGVVPLTAAALPAAQAADKIIHIPMQPSDWPDFLPDSAAGRLRDVAGRARKSSHFPGMHRIRPAAT
ncbi:MAG TPA: hypothetical protein VK726_16555 [Acetobacteraceae bacterium]|jgi:hypothetical protein|nr:hypothetical protein [Acetobacteraceae bacterium]